MAKITVVTDDCKRRISPQCTGKFSFVRRPGRPPVACEHCQKFKHTPTRTHTVINAGVRPTEGTCGCGNKFAIQPTGRISNRCMECREAGTVWRKNESGEVERISGEQHQRELSREEQEAKDAAGKLRADALFERMKPLLEKKTRTVIVH